MIKLLIDGEQAGTFVGLRQALTDSKKEIYAQAFVLAKGNVVRMSSELRISRGTVLKNLNTWFGKAYRNNIYSHVYQNTGQ